MSEYLRLPFLFGMTIEVGEALTKQNIIPQHTTTPLSVDEQVPDKTDSQQRVEASDPMIVATRIRKAHAAAKRKAEKNRELKGACGSEGSSKRRKEKSSDHIPCPTPLQTIVAVTSDVSRGDNVISLTQTQGDNLLEIPTHDSANTTTRLYEENHNEHSGVLGNRDGNFDDDVDEEIDLEGPDRHVSDNTEWVVIETESIPTAATRPDNGKSIAPEETPMLDPLPKGVGADGAGSSLPPSLFVPSWGIHQRSQVTTPKECRDLMVNLIPLGVREEMNLLDNNVVLDRAWFSLARGAMAQAHTLCQFKSLYDTHHALQESLKTVISGERLSENEGLRVQLAFAQKEKTDAIRKLLPTVVERLLQSYEYKQSLSVLFNYALQTGWGQGLAEERSKKELNKIMMRMNGFDHYSDKKMSAEYERLFSKTYSYVDRISHLSEKPVQDLLKLHPAPPPRDAPQAGSGGIIFAPKLVRAAEVAHSKDTTSKEFSRSQTGPSLQDPASKPTS
ncbi:hypothetical protein Tco_0514628 [Tanacetum coccineum]